MKKGQICEGVIGSMEFPNKGILTVPDEAMPVMVEHGLPGQKVRVVIRKVRRGKAEGRILEVLEPSPIEIEARCPHFGQCGGCAYQNLAYETQKKLKEDQVHAMMDAAIDGTYVFEGALASPCIQGYRNKMEFTFGDAYRDGPLALGMHKRGSFYDIVTTDSCQIVDEDFRKILKETLRCAKESGLSYYHRMRHQGFFRHLLVRKAARTQEILVDLVTTSQTDAFDWANWADVLRGLSLKGRIVGILHTKNDALADTVKDEGTEILYGQDFLYEEILGLRFKITPFSFFQTNSMGAEILYEKVREYIGDTKDSVIFDLYSGTGTIAQVLAPVAKKVVGVEIVAEAVEAARENAKYNGLSQCSFWAGDVLKVIDELNETPDLIVLDPPRDGVHPKALDKILRFGVERMIYIACKPTSLARDLEMIQGRGYQVEKVACIDLFPFTAHVETVVLLSRTSK